MIFCGSQADKPDLYWFGIPRQIGPEQLLWQHVLSWAARSDMMVERSVLAIFFSQERPRQPNRILVDTSNGLKPLEALNRAGEPIQFTVESARKFFEEGVVG